MRTVDFRPLSPVRFNQLIETMHAAADGVNTNMACVQEEQRTTSMIPASQRGHAGYKDRKQKCPGLRIQDRKDWSAVFEKRSGQW